MGKTDPTEDALLARVRQSLTFHVTVIEEEDGFSAFVEELPGCMTQADTEEELRGNVAEAIESYLRSVIRSALEQASPVGRDEWSRTWTGRAKTRRGLVTDGEFAFA